MLARIVKDENNNLTWERLTSSVVGSTPLGAVYAIWSNTVPDGFLPCNGSRFDRTQYPFLYNMLGTDYLPDLRECTLVGIGENSTDTLSTHDIYTLGQFKDFATAGFSSAKTAGYTISGNSVILNSTVNASNRKLVTQYVADADATDLQNLQTSSDTVTRMRSKGVNYIIKAIPGNEVGDYNYVIDQMEAQLALKVGLDYVNALPVGTYIENNIYGYDGHYYIGDHEHATLTELANLSDLEGELSENYKVVDIDALYDGAIIKYNETADKLSVIPDTNAAAGKVLKVASRSDSTQLTYYYTLDNTTYYNADLQNVVLPSETPSQSHVLVDTNVYLLIDTWYKHNGIDYYTVTAFTSSGATLGTVVTDSAIIDALNYYSGPTSLYANEYSKEKVSLTYNWDSVSLESLSDTAVCNANTCNGDLLSYNTTSCKWEATDKVPVTGSMSCNPTLAAIDCDGKTTNTSIGVGNQSITLDDGVHCPTTLTSTGVGAESVNIQSDYNLSVSNTGLNGSNSCGCFKLDSDGLFKVCNSETGNNWRSVTDIPTGDKIESVGNVACSSVKTSVDNTLDTSKVEIEATDVSIVGNTDITGNLNVSGNTTTCNSTVCGNLTVCGQLNLNQCTCWTINPTTWCVSYTYV